MDREERKKRAELSKKLKRESEKDLKVEEFDLDPTFLEEKL